MEIAAFLAPATTIGTCWRDGRMRENPPTSPSPFIGPAASAANRTLFSLTPSLPARRSSAPARPQCSVSQSWTPALEKPAAASSCACSGQKTTPQQRLRDRDQRQPV
jgi:hypothetical protein